jgi:amino acid transporter
VIVGIGTLFAALNVTGVKQGMGAILAISVAKFVPLAVFVLVGLTHVRPVMFADATVPAFGTLGEAALIVFYAFVGFEGALVPAGEAKDPRRDLPKALFVTALGGTLLYIGIQIVSVALTPDLAAPRVRSPTRPPSSWGRPAWPCSRSRRWRRFWATTRRRCWRRRA